MIAGYKGKVGEAGSDGTRWVVEDGYWAVLVVVPGAQAGGGADEVEQLRGGRQEGLEREAQPLGQ